MENNNKQCYLYEIKKGEESSNVFVDVINGLEYLRNLMIVHHQIKIPLAKTSFLIFKNICLRMS